MPTKINDGALTQQHIDAFDVALNGVHSDVLSSTTKHEVTYNGHTYEKTTDDLTLPELLAIIQQQTFGGIHNLTITSEMLDELRQLFPRFNQRAETILKLSPEQLALIASIEAKTYEKIEKAKEVVEGANAVVIITALAVTSMSIIGAGAVGSMTLMLLSALGVGVTGGLAFYLIPKAIFKMFKIPTTLPAPLEISEHGGKSVSIIERLTKLLADHPEYVSKRVSEFKNLREHLDDETNTTQAILQLLTNEPIELIELDSNEQKVAEPAIEYETVTRLKDIFAMHK